MHKGRPRTELASCTAWGRPWLWSILMLAVALLCSSATARAASDTKKDAQAAKPAATDYVGSETCATCHEEVAKGFASNPHTKIAEMHGKSGAGCESCHGAGKAHVDGGGDVTKIFNPNKHTSKEVDEKCLGCHAGQHQNFERSTHAKSGVGCTSCHSVHQKNETEHLLKASQPQLCYQCHADQRPAFSMLFHHKVNEGAVSCTDCHDAHGTFQKSNLRTTADKNAICTKCHTETRGPFVFEHAAVKAEGCVGCHTPHGSQNPRLLNMPNIVELCRSCHSAVATGTVHGMGEGSETATPCISCHTMIHGSNVSQAFIR